MPDHTTIPIPVVRTMIRPSLGRRLLFTFSDDMDPKVLGERVLDPVFICAARIESRRFAINEDGRATILPRANHCIHGAVYEVDDCGMTCLGLWLGVPSVHDRFGALARNGDGRLVLVEYHGTRNPNLGRAEPGYLRTIVDAARSHGFPAEYIEELERCNTVPRSVG